MKIIPSLFLLIALTACQNSLIADLVTQPGQALYHDDFSDPASGWLQATSADGSLGYLDNAYRMIVVTPSYNLRAVSGQTFGDVQLEVDAVRLGGPVSGGFGLICRYQDPSNFYFFIITSDGYFAIGKTKNANATLVGQGMLAYSAAISKDSGPNHLRFDCIGNTLAGYANNQPMAIARDSDFANGDAGLIIGAFSEGGVEISFDNFKVIKP
jgi:hypothetical protein